MHPANRQLLARAQAMTPEQLQALDARAPGFIRRMQELHREQWAEIAGDGARLVAAVAQHGEAAVRAAFQQNGVADLMPVAEQAYVRHVQAHPEAAPAAPAQTSAQPAPGPARGAPAASRQAVPKRSLDELWRAFDRLDDKGWQQAAKDPKFRDLVEHRKRLEQHSEFMRLLKDPATQQVAVEWLERPETRAFFQEHTHLRDQVLRGSHSASEVVLKLLRVAAGDDMLAEGRISARGAVLDRNSPDVLTRKQIVDELAGLFGTKPHVVRNAIEGLSRAELHDSLLVRSTSEGLGQRRVPAGKPTAERRAKEHLARLVEKDPRFKEKPEKVRIATSARYAAEKAYQKHPGEKQDLEFDARARRQLADRGELVEEDTTGHEPASPTARAVTEAAYEALDTEGTTDDSR
jgi:hypothetical protein